MAVRRKTTVSAKDIVVTKAEARKEIIDRLYVHCRYCNFFFLRTYPGDEVCDGPTCKMEQMIDEIDISELL